MSITFSIFYILDYIFLFIYILMLVYNNHKCNIKKQILHIKYRGLLDFFAKIMLHSAKIRLYVLRK